MWRTRRTQLSTARPRAERSSTRRLSIRRGTQLGTAEGFAGGTVGLLDEVEAGLDDVRRQADDACFALVDAGLIGTVFDHVVLDCGTLILTAGHLRLSVVSDSPSAADQIRAAATFAPLRLSGADCGTAGWPVLVFTVAHWTPPLTVLRLRTANDV